MGIVSRRLRIFINDEKGSISILVFGLFLILLTTSMILTDVTSIYLAKRSLTQASEAAVQRGMKNLDLESYYQGEYNINRLAANVIGESEGDPGIPIDCKKGHSDAVEVIEQWNTDGKASRRENLIQMRLSDFKCDGFQIYIESKAIARIPLPIPFINISEIAITSSAGGIAERAETNNYSGFDIG